jgi:hypothetical protein
MPFTVRHICPLAQWALLVWYCDGTAMVLQEVMAAWYRKEHRPANALLEEADQARLQWG